MNGKRELRLARALYQLTIYFESLRQPLDLGELYRLTYGELWQDAPGALWLEHLAQDDYVVAGMDDFHTLETIFKTMDKSGLGLLLDTIAEETASLGIHWGVRYFGTLRRPDDPKPDA
jgi:hypothetical protein